MASWKANSVTWWMAKRPTGGPLLSTVSFYRADAVAELTAQLERPWSELRKEGYRVVKILVIEEAK
jgi:hypothetical protein